ncbi:YceH family protein [Shewanella intestini]|uniref:DUF480 domain-containing protein n=1 Tax=Shewanella intestini TaxID=2017544 RepID=A0ABS5I194_9GAMM|nr:MULTISPECIES: YceH family protein [Shewanella]MBR9727785.1 DUF480 domain-containing protein [Shewanella intestini]MRG36222.1 DUF480 domain-containing protein [Shewanella sp. XMDDZSB0408]
MELNSLQTRVLGCLLEKEVTTPEQYPLSLNALTLACNQKSSREPVLSLTEQEVLDTIASLNKLRLISEQSGFGSRVVKYQHRFCNTEFSENQFSAEQLALICVLMLRGPQTPGELKQRCQRMYPFETPLQVESELVSLSKRNKPLIAQLAKQPNRRDHQYMQLFSTHEQIENVLSGNEITLSDEVSEQISQTSRLEQLELTVVELSKRIDELESLLK